MIPRSRKSKTVATKRRKIAIVAVYFPPQAVGGGTRVVSENVDTLIEQYGSDFDLVVFTSDYSQQQPHTVHLYSYRGVRVYRAGIVWRPYMDWHPKDPAMGELFSQFLRHEKPDLVHFHSVQRLSASVVEAALRLNIPYFVTVHDAWWISDFQFLVGPQDRVYPEGHPDPFETIDLPEGLTLDESLARRTYLKRLLNQARRALVVSETFAAIYQKNGIENTSVNKNGIKPRTWLPRAPSESGRVRLGHVGGMANHKGFHVFRDLLLHNDFDHLEALVVDLSLPAGQELHETWGTTPVTIIGKVAQDRIETLYSRIDVLVAPSIWPESYGLVTREACSAGCWTVASSIGAIGDDVQHGINGFVVEPTCGALLPLFEAINEQPGRYLVPPPIVSIRTLSEQVSELRKLYGDVFGQ
jgi:glycosyltransferase involved in cell wall biosynthesis